MGNIHYILFTRGSKLPNDCYATFVCKQNTKIKSPMCKEKNNKTTQQQQKHLPCKISPY